MGYLIVIFDPPACFLCYFHSRQQLLTVFIHSQSKHHICFHLFSPQTRGNMDETPFKNLLNVTFRGFKGSFHFNYPRNCCLVMELRMRKFWFYTTMMFLSGCQCSGGGWNPICAAKIDVKMASCLVLFLFYLWIKDLLSLSHTYIVTGSQNLEN